MKQLDFTIYYEPNVMIAELEMNLWPSKYSTPDEFFSVWVK